MVTFVYNSDIPSYKKAFDAKPLEVKIFTVFALVIGLGTIVIVLLFFKWYADTLIPFTGAITAILYLNPAIITIFNRPAYQISRFPIQVGIIWLLGLFMLFSINDLHPDSFSLHTTIPSLRVSPYRWLVSMVMPAIWIVILGIRPLIAFIQQRKLKHSNLLIG